VTPERYAEMKFWRDAEVSMARQYIVALDWLTALEDEVRAVVDGVSGRGRAVVPLRYGVLDELLEARETVEAFRAFRPLAPSPPD
jgi:hypothetical protein